MKLGIVGSGNIGGTAARLFANAGHKTLISNSRGPATLTEMVRGLGENACAGTVAEAMRFGDVVLLAVPWRSFESLPNLELLRGKIVIDAMNPYKPDGSLYDLGNSTSSEEVAKKIPGARLVKAFNTIYYVHLGERSRADLPVEERHAIFAAGDDAEAKNTVMRLIEEIGFAPVDTGTLHEGAYRQRPGSMIYNKVLTGAQAKGMIR